MAGYAESPSGMIDAGLGQDIFVEGIGLIERLAGSCMRITLYATRDLGGGETERVVVARLIAPLSLIPLGVCQVTKALAGLPFMTDLAPETVPH